MIFNNKFSDLMALVTQHSSQLNAFYGGIIKFFEGPIFSLEGLPYNPYTNNIIIKCLRCVIYIHPETQEDLDRFLDEKRVYEVPSDQFQNLKTWTGILLRYNLYLPNNLSEHKKDEVIQRWQFIIGIPEFIELIKLRAYLDQKSLESIRRCH